MLKRTSTKYDVEAQQWEDLNSFVENCSKLSKAQWNIIEEEREYFVQKILAKYLGRCTKFANNACDNIRWK